MAEPLHQMTRTAGSLKVAVQYDGVSDLQHLGRRHQWAYRLECSDSAGWEPVTGADLYLSPVAPNDAAEAMRTLLSFLTACGESYACAMRNPSAEPENLDPFADWVPEAAYLNSGELESLSLELDGFDDGDEQEPAYRDVLAADEVDPVATRDTPERLESVLGRGTPEEDPELAYALELEANPGTVSSNTEISRARSAQSALPRPGGPDW